jgi:hypothetical protein
MTTADYRKQARDAELRADWADPDRLPTDANLALIAGAPMAARGSQVRLQQPPL